MLYSEEEMKNSDIPDFPHLVNFPAHLHRYRTLSDVEKDRRRCVMCGETRLCSSSNSNQSREAFSRSKQKMAQSRGSGSMNSSTADEPHEPVHIIPKQNKGLCTACDVAVWIIRETGVEIKWCKGCKNFRPWAAFGDKGLATKCLRCRERQREKYATQKEEKFKKNASKNSGTSTVADKMEKCEKEKLVNADSKTAGSTDQCTNENSSNGTDKKFSSPDNHGMSCLIAATQVTRDA